MEDRLSFGPFSSAVSPESFTISREGRSVSVTPAEGRKLRALVGIAWGMEDLSTLPRQISDQPFRIQFSENGCELLKGEHAWEGLPFTFSECDDLIRTVDQSVTKAVDLASLSKRDLPPASTAIPDPEIF